MEKYIGEKSINSIMDFIEKIPLRIEPMSEERIQVIRNAYPDRKLPEEYISFLRRAGSYFIVWQGSDYVLVDKNNCFIDLREYVKEFDYDREVFEKFGFSYEDCFFFFSHQCNTYGFFRLDGSDDPAVYLFDSDWSVQQYSSRSTFTEFVVDSYNGFVEIIQQRKNPWDKIPVQMGEYALKYLSENFSYSSDCDFIKIPYSYDTYTINYDTVHSGNFLENLNPILKSCITDIRSVWVYSEDVMYLYKPLKDTVFDNPVNLNIYRNKTFIMDSEYKWGWFTVKDKVYVFGDKFRGLIKENLDVLSLCR